MRAHTKPLMVSGMGSADEVCRALEKLPLRAGGAGKTYDERWLQDTIQRHPHLLPVDEIEPALTPLVPVCTELPLPSGFADNLLITPDGGLVVVEAKLWRNPEARREVVGQVLDYAKDLQRLDYLGLQAAVRTALKAPASATLFGLVHPDGDPARETAFVDAVSRNLRLGRFLLLIAGDGIQESAEALADFLQRHVGLHFTLALVELSLWRTPAGEVLITPKVLARTVQIERAVVRLEEGVSAAAAPTRIEPVAASASSPRTLTETAFDEQLAQVDAALPGRLRAFMTILEPLGVYADLRASLLLKVTLPDGRSATLASIDAQGRVFTDGVPAAAMALGRRDLADAYKAAIAHAVPGGAVEDTGKVMGLRLVVHGRTPMLTQLLNHAQDWANAVADYLQALTVAAAHDASV